MKARINMFASIYNTFPNCCSPLIIFKHYERNNILGQNPIQEISESKSFFRCKHRGYILCFYTWQCSDSLVFSLSWNIVSNNLKHEPRGWLSVRSIQIYLEHNLHRRNRLMFWMNSSLLYLLGHMNSF